MSNPPPTPNGRTASNTFDGTDVYLSSHYLNKPSQVYGYIFWAIVLAFVLLFRLPPPTHLRRLLTLLSRWTIRKKRGIIKTRSKSSGSNFLPSNGNMVLLGSLFALLCILYLAGPDYIPGPMFKVKVDIPTLEHAINKSLWTSAARAGLVAYWLLPLCVLLALKASPSAIFSWRITLRLYFDKLAVFHKWTAVFLYFFTCLHVLLWTIKLSSDRVGPNGELAIQLAFQKSRFVCGCMGFAIFTILMGASTPHLRKKHYEAFYALHVFLFPLMLIMAALHHPETWGWPWAALALWLFERAWRGGRVFYLNYMITALKSPVTVSKSAPYSHGALSIPLSSRRKSRLDSVDETPYQPPPGYGHAELLSGATIRLTYVAQSDVQWAPGQHFLVNIPAISKFTSHPFTCATVSPEATPSGQDERRLVFLIRAKNGWTKDLWDAVAAHVMVGKAGVPNHAVKPPPGVPLPPSGLVMKMNIDGPFGSSVGVPWEKHSSVLIVVGGSGVTFGLAMLQHLCNTIAHNLRNWDTESYGQWRLRRVRFVWLVREFGHIQWCASIIRQCKMLLPEEMLSIDIFVTKPEPMATTPFEKDASEVHAPQPLSPTHNSDNESITSWESQLDTVESVGVADGHDLDLADGISLTEFEGDSQIILPGEVVLSERIKREGRVRRANSRKASMSRTVGAGQMPVSPRRGLRQEHSRANSGSDSEDPREGTNLLAPVVRGPRPMSRGFPAGTMGEDSLRHNRLQLPVATSGRRGSTALGQSRPLSSASLDLAPIPLHCAQPTPPQAFTHGAPIDEPISKEQAEDALPVQLRLNEPELRDLAVVAENAVPGKPKLARILEYELQDAAESVLVTCCGPISLDALVRETIASKRAQEDAKPDGKRIEYYSEEFDY